MLTPTVARVYVSQLLENSFARFKLSSARKGYPAFTFFLI